MTASESKTGVWRPQPLSAIPGLSEAHLPAGEFSRAAARGSPFDDLGFRLSSAEQVAQDIPHPGKLDAEEAARAKQLLVESVSVPASSSEISGDLEFTSPVRSPVRSPDEIRDLPHPGKMDVEEAVHAEQLLEESEMLQGPKKKKKKKGNKQHTTSFQHRRRKRSSRRRRTYKRKSMKRKSMKRKSMKRKSMKRRY